jgi:3-dehydroquinate synthase class II
MASGSPQVLGYNDRQVAKREGVPVADLIAEFQKNRAATIAAVDAADEALLAKEITSAGGASGPLSTVFNFVAVQHVLGHLADITGEKP